MDKAILTRIDQDVWKAIKIIAKENDRSITQEINRMLKLAIIKENRKIK